MSRAWTYYCVSMARNPGVTMDAPVPQSTCPTGAGVVPLLGEDVGDIATCYKVCNATADCRAGYQCDHLTLANGSDYFTNGICLPLDCLRTGMDCPSGYHCVGAAEDAGSSRGVCAAD